jgi:conjugal transfer ATP-binding protein TraC
MALLDFLNQKTRTPAPIGADPARADLQAGVLELQDVIAPSALKITPREINLGDKIARTFFVMSYPRTLHRLVVCADHQPRPRARHLYFIHPIDSAEILKKFQKKVAEVQSRSCREEKGLVRDPMLDTAYRDLEDLRDQLQQAQERSLMSACTSPSTAPRSKSSTKPRARSSRCSSRASCM